MSESLTKSHTVSRDVVIKHELGIHARPAALMVKIASRYNSEVYVEKSGNRVSGKSIMGLLTLEVYRGDTLRLIAIGDDASEAVAELVALVEKDFLLDKAGMEMEDGRR